MKLINSNLFFREIRFNLLSLILWTGILTLLVSVTMSVFPTFLQNQSKIMGMISLVPKTALQFKGISNLSDLSSVLGFYAINNVINMMVLGSVFSMVLGCNILLKEEYNHTAEYLMTRPITRTSIFISKLSVLFVLVLLLNILTSVAGYTAMRIVDQESFKITAFLTLSLYTFLLNFLFGALGLLISTLVKKPKPVTTLGIGLVLLFYFLFTISKITEGVSKIGYISPFRYARTDVLAADYGLGHLDLLFFGGLSILMLFLAYRVYLKKDIYF